MITIYKDKHTDKMYVLDEMVTMGNKVCLVPMGKEEDKFVSPNTLKRWYTKWDEAQVIVEVEAFTGMKIGLFKVDSYDKDTCTVFTKAGKELVFQRNTDIHLEDKQVNARNPKFANKLGREFGFFIPTWIR